MIVETIPFMLLALLMLAGAVAGGAIGYALLYWLPRRARTVASYATACLPNFLWLSTGGMDVLTALRESYFAYRTVLFIAVWALVLAVYHGHVKHRKRMRNRPA